MTVASECTTRSGAAASGRENAPSLAEFLSAPHKPVIVRPHPILGNAQVVDGRTDIRLDTPIGRPFSVETASFKGLACLNMKGLPNTSGKCFEGKKRYIHLAFQGVAKESVRGDHLCFGLEMEPLPPSLRVVGEFAMSIVSRFFASTSTVNMRATQPHVYIPLLAASHMINVSRQGEEPDIMEAEEDVRLWAPECTTSDGQPWPANKRRKFMDNLSVLKQKTLGGDADEEVPLVWTFHVYQHLVDISQYKLHAPWGELMNVDMAAWMAGQPIQFMARNLESGNYYLNFQVWHQRLLYGSEEERTTDEQPKSSLFGRAQQFLLSTKR